MPVDAFHQWWTQIAQRRALATHEQVTAPVGADVRIARDLHGIPHVLAENDWDLFFGFGWAIAEDRLFQLDWLRRKATGRLSEIVGCEGLESDRLVRTIGLSHIATAEWAQLTDPVRSLLHAFTAGINDWIDQNEERMPIEFDLLDYRPERWRELHPSRTTTARAGLDARPLGGPPRGEGPSSGDCSKPALSQEPV